LGGYGFQGVALGVDGSCKDGRMGAGYCKFREEGEDRRALVGREEEGASSNRPELGRAPVWMMSHSLCTHAVMLTVQLGFHVPTLPPPFLPASPPAPFDFVVWHPALYLVFFPLRVLSISVSLSHRR